MQTTERIWINGGSCRGGCLRARRRHGLHYGSGVFEGIRAYETPGGSAIFRLTDHLRRLHDSATAAGPGTPVHGRGAPRRGDRARRRERPRRVLPPPDRVLGLRGAGRSPRGNPVEVAIISWPWGRTSARRARPTGSARRSRRGSASGRTSIPHTAKATGIYVNSMLAVNEALDAGYDEAILLTGDGFVADGSGRTSSSSATARSTRRASPPRSCRGSRGTRSSRSPAASATGHRAEPDPLRPLPRGRGVHVRHGRRGDAAARGGQRRARRRPGDGSIRDEYLRCVVARPRYEPAWLEHVTLGLAA